MFGREFQLLGAVQRKAHPEEVILCNGTDRLRRNCRGAQSATTDARRGETAEVYGQVSSAAYRILSVLTMGRTGLQRQAHSSKPPRLLKQDAVLSQGVPRDVAVNFRTYRSFQRHRAVFTAIATLSN